VGKRRADLGYVRIIMAGHKLTGWNRSVNSQYDDSKRVKIRENLRKFEVSGAMLALHVIFRSNEGTAFFSILPNSAVANARGVMQCVAVCSVCCSVLQCVALCCGVLQLLQWFWLHQPKMDMRGTRLPQPCSPPKKGKKSRAQSMTCQQSQKRNRIKFISHICKTSSDFLSHQLITWLGHLRMGGHKKL